MSAQEFAWAGSGAATRLDNVEADDGRAKEALLRCCGHDPHPALAAHSRTLRRCGHAPDEWRHGNISQFPKLLRLLPESPFREDDVPWDNVLRDTTPEFIL